MWSIGSERCVLSLWSRGSALSHQSDGSVISSQATHALMSRRDSGDLPRGAVAAGVLMLLVSYGVGKQPRQVRAAATRSHTETT